MMWAGPEPNFEVNCQGLFCCRATLHWIIQIFILTSLRARNLFLSHYPRTQGHPGTGRMYETMQRQYFWPHMASDVRRTVADCRLCAQMWRTQRRQQKKLTLFPASGPHEFVAMDLHGSLPKTLHRNRHILDTTDRFTNMCRAVRLRTAQAFQVAQGFLDAWVYPYGMPDTLLTNNGPQFTAKFFESVLGMLRILHVLSTAYHPPTNFQAERFNRTLATRLRHYVSEQQGDWDDYVQLLTYAYNMQVHRYNRLSSHLDAPPARDFGTSTIHENAVLKWHRIDNGANEAVDSASSPILSRADTWVTHAQAQYKKHSSGRCERCPPLRSHMNCSSIGCLNSRNPPSRMRMGTTNSYLRQQGPIGLKGDTRHCDDRPEQAF